MNKLEKLGNIFIILSILALPIAFSISCLIGEVHIFAHAGISRYSWIMYLFTPVPILLIIIGAFLRIQNRKFKKYIIVGFICCTLFCVFGSSRFFYKDTISYEESAIYSVEDKLGIDLPKNRKTATIFYDNFTISYIKITDNDERMNFYNSFNKSQIWINTVSESLCDSLPMQIMIDLSDYDYFMLYNLTTNEYNAYPFDTGVYECIFIACDKDLNRLTILQDYEFTVL